MTSLTSYPHITLIVDNPLRDLDGLVLLARHLVSRGARVSLVPMYDQGFDVPALRPDVILLNYIRPNNIDLIKLYRSLGIRIAVLDTEGIAGKDANHFARLVAGTGQLALIDTYCLWGNAQKEALTRALGNVDRFVATGCPRYDYCAAMWRPALEKYEEPGYILINTNFPVVNPRFSDGSDRELQSMINSGFSPNFARQYVEDGKQAHKQVLAVAQRLARRFPDTRFVLRPHPFEKLSAYDALINLGNVAVRQEGTSLEWIAGARLLLHQNCSTAIEAGMLSVPAVSLEWFNTPALRLEVACGASRPAGSYEVLEAFVDQTINEQAIKDSSEQQDFRNNVISSLYFAIDGRGAERVSDAVFGILGSKGGRPINGSATGGLSLRGRAAALVRQSLGYNRAMRMRDLLSRGGTAARRRNKAFSPEQVRLVLQRLGAAVADGLDVEVQLAAYALGRKGSGIGPNSLILSKAVHMA